MKGADLRCPKCEGPAVDVAPDYDLELPWGIREQWTEAHCAQDHAFCLHMKATKEGRDVEYLPQVFERSR